jgi:hypothetical protein
MTRGQLWRARAFLLLSLSVLGCDGRDSHFVAQTTRALGITPAPERPTNTTKILLDASLQSPGSAETLAQVVDGIVPDIATRPAPSCIELWVMGATVGDAERLGETCVGSGARSKKDRRDAERRFQTTARTYLLGLAKPVFDRRPRRSPIAETLTRIAMEPTESTEQLLIGITDGREESDIARLECGPLPTVEMFHAALHAARALEPGSLKGIHIRFAFVGFTDAKRAGCDTTLRRELETQELWRSALQRASARSVHFDSAAPRIATTEVRK